MTYNRPPTAQNDSYTTYKNTPLSVGAPGVLANDSDPDGDALTAELVSGPTQGTLTLNPNGSFTYTPPANFAGTVTFTYRAKDSDGAYSSTATVTITVENRAPTAQNDSYTTYKNTPLSVSAPGVLANDSDPDGDALTAELVSGPTQGTLTLNPNGSFTYTPPANWTGTTTFTYRAKDTSNAYSNTATVTITVQNRSPTAQNDNYYTYMGIPLTRSAPGVLANDFDPDGDPLTVELVTPPTNGTVTLNSDGSFVYTPNPGFWGDDYFWYRCWDGTAYSNVARVWIGVLDYPIGQNDSFTIFKNTPTLIPAPGVLANDYDPRGRPLTVSPAVGNCSSPDPSCPVALTIYPDGAVFAVPLANYTGSYSAGWYGLRNSDGQSQCCWTVTIHVQNRSPVAENDSYTTHKNTPLTINTPGVLANDSDPDPSPESLTAELLSGPAQGTLTLNPNGSFTYTPPANWTGTTTFTYRAKDTSNAYSNTATVTITVQNRAPTAQNDSYTTVSYTHL
ncbi:MAG: cadherin-like domain-containing protein, partial [Candidatus Bipolaricaulota bacterium]|nr:cadherin-like domain-containing protein [Candidatus Bipolaricaulota bacterium]